MCWHPTATRPVNLWIRVTNRWLLVLKWLACSSIRVRTRTGNGAKQVAYEPSKFRRVVQQRAASNSCLIWTSLHHCVAYKSVCRECTSLLGKTLNAALMCHFQLLYSTRELSDDSLWQATHSWAMGHSFQTFCQLNEPTQVRIAEQQFAPQTKNNCPMVHIVHNISPRDARSMVQSMDSLSPGQQQKQKVAVEWYHIPLLSYAKIGNNCPHWEAAVQSRVREKQLSDFLLHRWLSLGGSLFIIIIDRSIRIRIVCFLRVLFVWQVRSNDIYHEWESLELHLCYKLGPVWQQSSSK